MFSVKTWALFGCLAFLTFMAGTDFPAHAQTVVNAKVTTAAPTYPTNSVNSLSLTTAGGLRVSCPDGTCSGGGGGGGTSSAFSAAFPANGTAAGGKDVTSGLMLPLIIDDTTKALTVDCLAGCTAGSGVVQGNATSTPPTYTAGANALSLDFSGNLRTSVPGGVSVTGGSVGLLAGAAIVGKVGVDQTTPGTTNGVQTLTGSTTAVTSLPAIPAGTNVIGHVITDTGSTTAVSSLPATPAGSNIIGNVRIDQTTPGTTNGVTVVPTASNTSGIASTATTAVASNLVGKGSAGNFYAGTITTGATAGFGMLFNATALPANGAVTPVNCWVIPANSTAGISYGQTPYVASTGITIGFSSTGCFTLTASATAFISEQVK